MATIPMPQMTLAYWVDRARAELAEGRAIAARGSMRRALTQLEGRRWDS